MCGIVGYIGTEEAAPILLEGLRRLEYRGYDSAGLAVLDPEQGLQVAKAKGRLQVLADLTGQGQKLTGHMGLGHTRWATHGAPNDVNSHPQVSQSGRIAVVHNGIIENYARLKEFLESKGIAFVSETDTEVVAQLLDYYYEGDLLDAVGKVLHRIEGAYALGIVCADEPDRLVAVRKDSPLILGYGANFHMLASDVTAVIQHTREVCYLEDGEVAVLTAHGAQVYNSLLQPVEKEISHVDWEISAAEKGGYEHFMFKEIMEQPKALRDTIVINGSTTFMVGLSSAFAAYLSLTGIPRTLAAALIGVTDNKIILLILINIFLLVIGCLVDNIPATIILAPILLPVVEALGMSPVTFGIMLTMNLAIGFCTPPYGIDLFVASAISGVSIGKMMKFMLWFIFSLLVVLMLVTYWPAFTMFALA